MVPKWVLAGLIAGALFRKMTKQRKQGPHSKANHEHGSPHCISVNGHIQVTEGPVETEPSRPTHISEEVLGDITNEKALDTLHPYQTGLNEDLAKSHTLEPQFDEHLTLDGSVTSSVSKLIRMFNGDIVPSSAEPEQTGIEEGSPERTDLQADFGAAFDKNEEIDKESEDGGPDADSVVGEEQESAPNTPASPPSVPSASERQEDAGEPAVPHIPDSRLDEATHDQDGQAR